MNTRIPYDTLKPKAKKVLRIIYQIEESGKEVRPILVARSLGFHLTRDITPEITLLCENGFITKTKITSCRAVLALTHHGKALAATYPAIKEIVLVSKPRRGRGGGSSGLPKNAEGIYSVERKPGLIISDKEYRSLMDGVDYSRGNIKGEISIGKVPSRGLSHSGCSPSMEAC